MHQSVIFGRLWIQCGSVIHICNNLIGDASVSETTSLAAKGSLD